MVTVSARQPGVPTVTAPGSVEHKLAFPGSTGSYLSMVAGESVASFNGDFTLLWDGEPADWTPAAAATWLIGKGWAFAGGTGYRLLLLTDGTLRLSWMQADDTARTLTSTAATGAADGARLRVKATLDVDDGGGDCLANFYTSTDFTRPLIYDTSWAQLGSADVALGATSDIETTTLVPTLGGRSFAGDQPLAGDVYAGAWYDSNDTLTVSVSLDSRNSTVGASSFVDRTGYQWNANSNAAIVTSLPQRPTITPA